MANDKSILHVRARHLIALFMVMLAACADEDNDRQPPVATTGLVVFMGDSITQSWPIEDYVEGAVNAGVAGDDTAQMLSRFERDVLSRHPTVVVILGGINDIRSHATTDSGNLMSMVQLARAANIGVVVGTLTRATDLGADPALKRDLIVIFNEEIRTAATAYGYEVADYYSVTGIGNRVDKRAFPDGLHPSRRGYDAMWQALRPALDRLGVVRD
jgi:acyl-CoA thioesterase-1